MWRVQNGSVIWPQAYSRPYHAASDALQYIPERDHKKMRFIAPNGMRLNFGAILQVIAAEKADYGEAS